LHIEDSFYVRFWSAVQPKKSIVLDGGLVQICALGRNMSDLYTQLDIQTVGWGGFAMDVQIGTH
jgi:hypothetical protein